MLLLAAEASETTWPDVVMVLGVLALVVAFFGLWLWFLNG